MEVFVRKGKKNIESMPREITAKHYKALKLGRLYYYYYYLKALFKFMPMNFGFFGLNNTYGP